MCAFEVFFFPYKLIRTFFKGAINFINSSYLPNLLEILRCQLVIDVNLVISLSFRVNLCNLVYTFHWQSHVTNAASHWTEKIQKILILKCRLARQSDKESTPSPNSLPLWTVLVRQRLLGWTRLSLTSTCSRHTPCSSEAQSPEQTSILPLHFRGFLILSILAERDLLCFLNKVGVIGHRLEDALHSQ